MKNENYADKTIPQNQGPTWRLSASRKVLVSRSKLSQRRFGESGLIGTDVARASAQARDRSAQAMQTIGRFVGKVICTFGVLCVNPFAFSNARRIWRKKSFDFKEVMIACEVCFCVLTDMAVAFVPR